MTRLVALEEKRTRVIPHDPGGRQSCGSVYNLVICRLRIPVMLNLNN
jgi:hypothetical protein